MRARRGTSKNPFDCGERVRVRGSQDLGTVMERAWFCRAGYSYMIRLDRGLCVWRTTRELEGYSYGQTEAP